MATSPNAAATKSSTVSITPAAVKHHIIPTSPPRYAAMENWLIASLGHTRAVADRPCTTPERVSVAVEWCTASLTDSTIASSVAATASTVPTIRSAAKTAITRLPSLNILIQNIQLSILRIQDLIQLSTNTVQLLSTVTIQSLQLAIILRHMAMHLTTMTNESAINLVFVNPQFSILDYSFEHFY